MKFTPNKCHVFYWDNFEVNYRDKLLKIYPLMKPSTVETFCEATEFLLSFGKRSNIVQFHEQSYGGVYMERLSYWLSELLLYKDKHPSFLVLLMDRIAQEGLAKIFFEIPLASVDLRKSFLINVLDWTNGIHFEREDSIDKIWKLSEIYSQKCYYQIRSMRHYLLDLPIFTDHHIHSLLCYLFFSDEILDELLLNFDSLNMEELALLFSTHMGDNVKWPIHLTYG